MAIRYDEKLNKEIRSIVNKYNAKIRRLEKTENDYILPNKFDRKALKNLKSSVSTRIDLRRRLKDLQTFIERGSEKNIIINKTSIPLYQYKNIKRYQSLIKRRINTKIKFYETTKPTSAGIENSITFATMGEKDYLNALAKKKLLLEKDIDKLDYKEREKFLELLQSNAKTIPVVNWQNNYLDILIDTGKTYGYDLDKLNIIEEKIKKLNPSSFNRLFNTERTIQQILYYYKPIKDLGVDIALDNMQNDALTNFENLFDNLDDILKDYE